MATNKTTENLNNVDDFLTSIKAESKQNDCFSLMQLIEKQTGYKAKMWGTSIVGFGSYHYKYESGREGDAPIVAFSPRASSIAIYLSANFLDRASLLEKFGKHKSSKGCIHINQLVDVDKKVLEKMISNHIAHVKELYPDQ